MTVADADELINEVAREVSYTSRLTGRAALSERVMTALRDVPRHEFVPQEAIPYAYINEPLAIGYGQTISQPYIVALMTDLLEPRASDMLLEVGTGSGYQAAVLSRLVSRVYTVEIIEPLHRQALATLRRLGYRNVECRLGDGYFGWPQAAPFDGIVVTAAAPGIPEPLVGQLKPGARLVVPVGSPHGHQQLTVVEKGEKGEIQIDEVLGVVFVPLTGEGRGSAN
ncbi:MAG: protein-L-isoaspartate(D-aspartate) O-methyltransferase [Gammaproteobacteria bacterium]|nr:protein-L-isoaspartate(D-aspartate) O-methyltransferase [Gammaproteobacteria bacterium]